MDGRGEGGGAGGEGKVRREAGKKRKGRRAGRSQDSMRQWGLPPLLALPVEG